MVTIFFSYSHRDEEIRNEVEAALSPLRRQGLINIWHDRRIMPGSDFETEIDSNLEAADIILLLVSNYFVNSDYAYGIELKRALERHESGEARVIPIILRHTDWHSLSFGKLQALPPDGKPVTSFPDFHEALTSISKGVRRVIEEITGASGTRMSSAKDICKPASSKPLSSVTHEPRSSNLRIKKTFNDREKDLFLDKSFEYIANFFENSLEELEKRNQGIEARFERVDAGRLTATVYRNGQTVAECTVFRGDRSGFIDGIAYSSQRTSGSNSYNDLLSVDDDGYVLSLTPQMGQIHHGGEQKQLSNLGASEYLWEMLIGALQ